MTIDGWIMKTQIENNNVMSRYDHKIETSLEGIGGHKINRQTCQRILAQRMNQRCKQRKH